MKNHIGMKYTFLGTKSTEKVLKSDEKFCTEKKYRVAWWYHHLTFVLVKHRDISRIFFKISQKFRHSLS